MKISFYILLSISILFICWQLWHTFLIGVDQPSYTVIEKKNGYEVRHYDEYITANVTVPGLNEKAVNKGFRILADYIFGKNSKKIKIPMMAPVIIEKRKKSEETIVSFVLPQKYSKKTAPEPINKSITIKKEHEHTAAIFAFTCYPTENRVERKKEQFKELLKQDRRILKSKMKLARYNPPFILPFLLHNELMVHI